MSERYFIRKYGFEAGWIYLHKPGSFEDADSIELINELVPGDYYKKANKTDFVEINKETYEKILDVNSKGQDIVEVIKTLVPGIF